MGLREIFITCYAVIFIIALLIELFTNEMVSIWFAIGAVFAIIFACIMPIPVWISIIAFVFFSGITLFVFCLFFRKKFFQKKKIHTNADSLIGKEFVLLENTISKKSTIKVNDVIWNCECEEDLPAGTTVIILKIVGNHFIVKEKEKK